MGEEIKITAKMDTSDADSGVERIAQAADKIRAKLGDAMKVPDKVPEDAGGKAGEAFSKSFIKRLVIRDAIYGLIRGFSTAFETAFDNLDKLTGKLAGARSIWQGIGDTLSSTMVALLPSVRASSVATFSGSVAQDEAVRRLSDQVEQARENPAGLKMSQSQIESSIRGFEDQRGSALRNYDAARLAAGETGDIQFAKNAEAQFRDRDRFFSQMEEHLRQLLAIAKERDKKEFSDIERHKADKIKNRDARILADEFMAGQERKDAAAADKHAKAVEKNHRAHELEAERLELSTKGPRADLREMERLMGHQHATSAVLINGGLYGRNDSAFALVNHAAQQVSLLRSIDSQIKHIRSERSELTLL